MGKPVAKKGDKVIGTDTHIVLVSSPGGPVPTPIPLPFNGTLLDELSSSVCVDNAPAAVVGSKATNTPPHVPTGGPFQNPPSNQGTVKSGSSSVFANNRPIARANDPVECCNDPVDQQTGMVVAMGTVAAGG